jgi:hypothetical protein
MRAHPAGRAWCVRASLAVVRRLGFGQTGVQVDEIEGEELVFAVGRPEP